MWEDLHLLASWPGAPILLSDGVVVLPDVKLGTIRIPRVKFLFLS